MKALHVPDLKSPHGGRAGFLAEMGTLLDHKSMGTLLSHECMGTFLRHKSMGTLLDHDCMGTPTRPWGHLAKECPLLRSVPTCFPLLRSVPYLLQPVERLVECDTRCRRPVFSLSSSRPGRPVRPRTGPSRGHGCCCCPRRCLSALLCLLSQLRHRSP